MLVNKDRVDSKEQQFKKNREIKEMSIERLRTFKGFENVPNKDDDRLIELKEVCKRIKSTDIRTAIKWCEKTEIPIIIKGKKKLTYRFLVDTELDKGIIQFLQSKYPDSWEKMYLFYVNNDSLGYILETQQ